MLSKAGILIVEDSFIVAYHLQTTLESEGYRVLGTEDSGEGALIFLEKNKPDLILMDIMLNGPTDGIETARTIKQKYNLPIIYITALSDKDTIQRAKVTEPHGYLTKPFEDREIFTVIEMALYKHDIESRLRQSEEQYFSTIRSISDAVVVLDKHFCINYLNPSAEYLTGWTLPKAQGKPILEVMRVRYTDEEGSYINPMQCGLDGSRMSSLPKNLLLVSSKGHETPIGEGSISPVIDNKENCTGLVMIFKNLTEKTERERLMKEFEIQRMAALFEGQEKERIRIAKDLHDGLGQMLNAVKMSLNLNGTDNKRTEELSKLIDEAIQESIRISENLLPSKLRDFDLATCLRSLCTQMRSSLNLQISFESLGAPQELDQTRKINFYRIAQEALNNAVKHSHASSIIVQLNEEADVIQLSVEDDGQGLAAAEKVKSKSARNGLVNMRERAEIMGGTFIIESDENRGTLIIVEAPIQN
jgi:PAS domain S-box-containing protein